MKLKKIETAIILGKELEIYGDRENPLFLAKDIADWIEHSQVSKMVETLETGIEKLNGILFLSGQNREVVFLTEDGVYEVLMTSRKKVAKNFRQSLKNFLRSWRKQEVKVINNNMNSSNNILQATKNLLELGEHHEERINTLENKIDNSITIESYQRGVLQKLIGKRVSKRYYDLGEKVEKKKLYSNIHRDIKYKFNVRSYGDIRKKDYSLAIEFIEGWIENSKIREK